MSTHHHVGVSKDRQEVLVPHILDQVSLTRLGRRKKLEKLSKWSGLTLLRPLSHLCDGRSHSFRDHGRIFATKTKALLRLRNFFVLSPLVLRVVSFESVYSALSDDVWYCSGWYWKFLRNIDLKSRHAKCVRSAWPECIDSVARCGSSITCASMELARCGSSSTCARYGATIFPCV